jgi:hypothetical protein
VASISRGISMLPGVCSASHRSAASISGAAFFSRWLYSLLPQQAGEQVPGPGWSGAQPVPLVVMAPQHLRRRQARQLSVGHLCGPARPGPGQAG